MVPPSRPRHDDFSRFRRGYELASIVTAGSLLVVQVLRVGLHLSGSSGWIVLAAVAGAFAADLVSGMVHWTADTWGRETMPLVGRRILRPFRVHHVNPGDFLRRDFLDTNGDVALIASPFLLSLFWIPLDANWGQTLAAFLLSFCAVGLPTNQVHQWAHMPHPPRGVAWLQRCGILLRTEAHAQHHESPFAMNYCIATGWCNPVLTRLGFFRRLERLVTGVTGARPRLDDVAFQQIVAEDTQRT